MEKVDLTKTRRAFFTAGNKPALVELPAVQYLSITGKGDPSGPDYAQNISALFSTTYTLKFALKAKELDFAVAKLEGQWWFNEQQYGGVSMSDAPKLIPRSEWEYRMLIMMPDFVTETALQAAIESVVAKKQLETAKNVRLITLEEGKCVQIMHNGPFDREPETLLLVKDFCEANGLLKNGHHHEVYLSDFNKTAPEKLKTILREPVR